MERKIIIGSRGSELALWQANHICSQLQNLGVAAEIRIIKTKGDKLQHLSFDKIEGKGFFTKEIEEALLSNEVDLAVHSHKDLETRPPEGLRIAAVSDREDPSELLLIRKEAVDQKQILDLKKNAVVGTSSARRKSQLLAYRKDLELKDLRGNVPTRIQKLREKNFDGILLAYAGVKRLELDLSEFHTVKVSPREFIPAQAQGVLAYQIREDDSWLFKILQKINEQAVKERITIEREVLRILDGGCLIPLGIYCEKRNNVFHAWASFSEDIKVFPRRIYLTSPVSDGFANQIAKAVTSRETASVFITRDEKPDEILFRALADNGFKVFGQSLIELKVIPFSKIPKTDWIFFSSRNAVNFFFEQKPDVSRDVKFGVIGQGTEKALKNHGKTANYTGNASSTKLSAKAFATIAAGQSVLFPGSAQSLRTVQSEMTNSKIVELTVYKTVKKNINSIPYTDFVVFTSPSNVNSFFSQQEVKKKQIIIAIGTSTAKALDAVGIKNYYMPFAPDEIGILDEIFALASKQAL